VNLGKGLGRALGGMAVAAAANVHAASLNPGDVLTLDAGVAVHEAGDYLVDVSSGSWFAIDMNANRKIAGSEKTALSQGTTGIVIGLATAAGASHVGTPTAGDTNAITAPWEFFGNTGSDFTSVGITGSTEAGLDFSGWSLTFAGVAYEMGSGAWESGFTDGVANFAWDGSYGSRYTLDYAATVPYDNSGPVTGFGSVEYRLHLEGTVQAVPEASSWGMMLAGLGLVGLAVRCRMRRPDSQRG
jgi:hypothetical protein